MGDEDQAFVALEKNFELGDRDWLYLEQDPWFESLRDDPRFHEQERRMQAIVDAQAANVRALLATHDINALLAPVIEVHASARAPEPDEETAGSP